MKKRMAPQKYLLRNNSTLKQKEVDDDFTELNNNIETLITFTTIDNRSWRENSS